MIMGYTKRNCDHCQKEYMADNRNLKRGWGLCCSKSCAANKRERSRPDYDPLVVARNNRIRAGKPLPGDYNHMTHAQKMRLNQARFGEYSPSVHGTSGVITGITSEGYRIVDGIAYNEFDEPEYTFDPDDDDAGDSMYWDSKDYS